MTDQQYDFVFTALNNINKVEKGRLESSYLFQFFNTTERKELDKIIYKFDLDIIIQGLKVYTEVNKTFTKK